MHKVHTLGIRSLHIAFGVTETVIQSHPCRHGFRISIVNALLVTLQLVFPWLPHFQGYDTAWLVNNVTTEGAMISVDILSLVSGLSGFRWLL